MDRFLLRRAAGYNPTPPSIETADGKHWMKTARQDYFKELLLTELRRHARNVGDEQASALDMANDDAKESSDLALRDTIQELSLRLGDRESKMVAEIDQALMRMKEGSYGICVRCGDPIDERRLEAMP